MTHDCPTCGEPARIVIVTVARVRCELEDDGTIGRVVSASKSDASTITYECGGAHAWSPTEGKRAS